MPRYSPARVMLLLRIPQGVIATTLVAACVTASTTAALAFEFGDGTHRVGVDIPPGTYRAPDIKRTPGPFSPFVSGHVCATSRAETTRFSPSSAPRRPRS